MTLSLIAFDCDGTLVDSGHLIVTAMEKAFKSAHLKSPDKQSIQSIIGLSLDEAIMSLLDDSQSDHLLAIKSAYINHFMQMRDQQGYIEPFYEGAIETIQQLHQINNIVMGICTGKSRRGLQKIIEAKQLEPYIVTRQAGDEHPSKPHPAMLERALFETGTDAQNSVMIGDTTFDIEMGKEAGTKTIGVSWGYHEAEELKKSGADIVIDHFDELVPLLKKWGLIDA